MTAFQRRVVKMGASVGLTLPAEVCSSMGITLGSRVLLSPTKKGLLVRPAPVLRLSLAERIARSSVEAVRNAGRELLDAPAVGREWP